MVGEEGGVASGPEESAGMSGLRRRRGRRMRAETAARSAERVEDVADPEAVGDGVAEDGEGGGRGDAGVGVGAEEVVIVVEKVGPDDEAVVGEPDDWREGDGGEGEAEKRAETVFGAGPEDPGDRGEEKDGGGLGEDHEGKEEAKSEDGDDLTEASSQGMGDSLLRRGVGGGEKGEEREEDEQRLEDGHAGEDVTEGTDREKKDGDGGGEGGVVSALVGSGAERFCQRRSRR